MTSETGFARKWDRDKPICTTLALPAMRHRRIQPLNDIGGGHGGGHCFCLARLTSSTLLQTVIMDIEICACMVVPRQNFWIPRPMSLFPDPCNCSPTLLIVPRPL